MRVLSTSLYLGLVLGTAAPLVGQNPQCNQFAGNLGNLCNAAIDGITVYHPVAGQILSGGNPVLGRVGTLGGLGHFAVSFQGTAARVTLADASFNGSSNVVAAGSDIIAPGTTIGLAAGIYPGMDNGLLAVDLLGALHLLPAGLIDNLSVGGGSGVALGYGIGARVGLYDPPEGRFSATASFMWRSIPVIAYGQDSYSFESDIRQINLRGIAGWNLSLFSLGFGVGVDWYKGDGAANFFDATVSPIPFRLDVGLNSQRFLLFTDFALVLPVVSLAFELGYQFGQSEPMATTFQGRSPDDGLLFFGAGFGFRF